MQINTPEEFATIRGPREFTQAECQRIAEKYRKRKAERAAEGKPLPSLSIFMGKILNAAVAEDR